MIALGTSAPFRIFHTLFPAAPEKKCENSGKAHLGAGGRVSPDAKRRGPARFRILSGRSPRAGPTKSENAHPCTPSAAGTRRLSGFSDFFSGSAGKKV